MSDNNKSFPISSFVSLMLALVISGFVFSPYSKSLFKHKAQHHEGEYFENWSSANEFEASRLIGFGKILKVGKDNYQLAYTSCSLIRSAEGGFIDVTDIEYFDRVYKIVTLQQATDDVNKECFK